MFTEALFIVDKMVEETQNIIDIWNKNNAWLDSQVNE